MQTTNFSTPTSKEYYDGEKRKIMEKYRQRELFPPSDYPYYPEMPTNLPNYQDY